jgi:hypothetical protein
MRAFFRRRWARGTVLLSLIALASIPLTRKQQPAVPLGSLRAFSLREAERRLKQEGRNAPGVLTLGGITRLIGVVVGASNDDVILIGEAREGDLPLSLDDLASVLRAVLVRGVFPGCSIDRTPQSTRTQLQRVRFVGDIENSPLADRLLQADITLKLMATGHSSARSWRGTSYFLLRVHDAHAGGPTRGLGARWWFRNLAAGFTVRDRVFSVDQVQIGVSTEFFYFGSSSAASVPSDDQVALRFAESVTKYLQRAPDPELSMLRGLLEMGVIAKGMLDLPTAPDLKWWLSEYRVPFLKTQTTYPLLHQEEMTGTPSGRVRVVVEGGVDLEPLLIQWEAGRDVTALRKLVLAARPGQGALTWAVPQRGVGMVAPNGVRVLGGQGEARPQQLGCTVDSQVVPEGRRAAVVDFDARSRVLAGIPSFQIVDRSALRIPPVSLRPAPGGVLIEPRPTLAGRDGAVVRDRILRSRRSGDDLSFDTTISQPEERP